MLQPSTCVAIVAIECSCELGGFGDLAALCDGALDTIRDGKPQIFEMERASMRISLFFIGLTLLCTNGATQAEAAREGKAVAIRPQTPQTAILALLTEYDASKRSYSVKFAEFRPRFEAFAEKHRGSDAGLEAELWLFSGCWWSRKDGSMNEKAAVVADRILEHYKDSEELGKMLDLAYVFSTAQKEEYGQRLLKLSQQPGVQAAVHMMLGKLYQRSKDTDKRKASREHFLLLSKKFKGVPYRSTTYGAMAEAFLHPHATEVLAIGKLAPEITGTGVDGKAMKLSDFRGKVVVLDFWGDW